jgi:hypothetical protein
MRGRKNQGIILNIQRKRGRLSMVNVKSKIRDYTKEEWEALRKKLENPDETVFCPRCGNEISYKEIGNSVSVKCLTEKCIFGGLRGI